MIYQKTSKPSKYRTLLRDYCVIKTIDKQQVTFTEYFSTSIKVEALTLELIKIVFYRKNKNTLIYFADEFSNTVSMQKLTDIECKLIYLTLTNKETPKD